MLLNLFKPVHVYILLLGSAENIYVRCIWKPWTNWVDFCSSQLTLSKYTRIMSSCLPELKNKMPQTFLSNS